MSFCNGFELLCFQGWVEFICYKSTTKYYARPTESKQEVLPFRSEHERLLLPRENTGNVFAGLLIKQHVANNTFTHHNTIHDFTQRKINMFLAGIGLNEVKYNVSACSYLLMNVLFEVSRVH